MVSFKHLLILFLVIALSFAVNGENALQEIYAQHPVFHGSKTVAGFHVELTVEPTPIEPGTLTKFGTVFRNAETGEPASEVPHTMVLTKDGDVIFRESTTSADYIHEFMFSEEHKGTLTILIENVNDSGESAEFSLTVVPEFPMSAMFAMTSLLVIMLVILRSKGFSSALKN
ncbi:MAG: hypothetical protein ACE5KA_03090 [Nitrososphaerales archaeon]